MKFRHRDESGKYVLCFYQSGNIYWALESSPARFCNFYSWREMQGHYSIANTHISYYLINYINKVIRCLRFGLFRVAAHARGWICAECL